MLDFDRFLSFIFLYSSTFIFKLIVSNRKYVKQKKIKSRNDVTSMSNDVTMDRAQLKNKGTSKNGEKVSYRAVTKTEAGSSFKCSFFFFKETQC